MITVFNAQNYAQQWFFDKAFALLKAKELLNADEEKYGRFLSLDGYFAHMQDLVLLDPVFTLIPSDEEPFVIDANARTISIPAAFNKCAGVVGDNMCEIATFTIDRYFDYVDLATAQICIQWSTADGEGISHIGLRDLETMPGKIRFGWPLTKELTAKPGPVTFAVRFFMKNEADTEFVYLLNTLSTTITIRQGLNVVNPKFDLKDTYSLFGQFVQNSNNPTYPDPAPVYFNNNPGLNLLPQEKIKEENDSLILKAQAVVADNGHINYAWYFKENATPDSPDVYYEKAETYNDNEKYYMYDATLDDYVEAWPNETNFHNAAYYTREISAGVKLETSKNYEITEEYEPIATPEKRNGSEQYYILDDTTSPPSYKLVTSAELPAAPTQLYERYTQLRFKTQAEGAGTDVTGLYWVGATNYVGATVIHPDDFVLGEKVDDIYEPDALIRSLNATNETQSTRCYIPTPANVNIVTDLPEDKFLDEVEGELKTTLTVVATEDSGLPQRTYSWYYNPNGKEYLADDAVPVIAEIDKNSFDVVTAAKAGWYYTHIDSKLNRKGTDATSKICRVIEHTKAPVLEKMEYKKWTEDMMDNLKDAAAVEKYFETADWETVYEKEVYDPANPETYHEMSNLVAKRGDIIRLKITTDLDTERFNKTGLKSDEVVYKWFVVEPDQAPRELDISDIDVTGNGFIPYEDKYTHLHKPYIDIRCRENDYECHFYCVVENTLAGETNTLGAEDYKLVFKVW